MKKSEEPQFYRPVRPDKFSVKGFQVFLRDKLVLHALSRTMARRAAAALNRYKIGKRGY